MNRFRFVPFFFNCVTCVGRENVDHITYSVLIGYTEQVMSLSNRKVNVPINKHEALETVSWINTTSLTIYSWECHIILKVAF